MDLPSFMTHEGISLAQKAELLALHAGGHNGLNGQDMAQKFAENSDLWNGMIYGWDGFYRYIRLRDLPDGGGDTICVLTTEEHREAVCELLAKSSPSELHYHSSSVREEDGYGLAIGHCWKGYGEFSHKPLLTTDFGGEECLCPLSQVPVFKDVVLVRAYWN